MLVARLAGLSALILDYAVKVARAQSGPPVCAARMALAEKPTAVAGIAATA
jgi:hypothetical protein